MLTDVALAAPNAVVARVRGKTHPTLPSHRYVMVTEGLSVALNMATDGNLTHGWTSEPPMHSCPPARLPSARPSATQIHVDPNDPPNFTWVSHARAHHGEGWHCIDRLQLTR